MIESGSGGQGSPDSPQDTPPSAEGGLFGPPHAQDGVRWGLGVVGLTVALVSVLVLGSYHGTLADDAQATPPTVAAPVPGPEESRAPDPDAEQGGPEGTDPEPAGNEPADTEPAGTYPAEGTVPTEGSGQVQVARFTRAAPVEQTGRTVRVRVEVENEMPTDPEAVAEQAADILQDERSWSSKRRVRFAFVGDAGHDLVIRVLTPTTTDQRCRPLRTLGQVSCSIGSAVNLNGIRWETGVPDYAGDLDGYRTYLVNHEVGHYLGLGHVECPGPGQPAPVMMQQTKGLKGCARNPWP